MSFTVEDQKMLDLLLKKRRGSSKGWAKCMLCGGPNGEPSQPYCKSKKGVKLKGRGCRDRIEQHHLCNAFRKYAERIGPEAVKLAETLDDDYGRLNKFLDRRPSIRGMLYKEAIDARLEEFEAGES